MKFIIRMYNKNGCGQGCGLSIRAWHVGVFIMVPESHLYAAINYVPHYPHDGLGWENWWENVTILLEICALL